MLPDEYFDTECQKLPMLLTDFQSQFRGGRASVSPLAYPPVGFW